MSVEKQTADFLYLLCRYMKANPGCIVAVKDHDTVSANMKPLGYCDNTYYYIRPEICIPCFRAVEYPDHKVDMLLILRKLFAMDYIKVHWILTGQVRYRPQKRVGKTRKRYITLYRKQLDNFMNEHFVKAVAAEKGISSRQAYNSVNAVMDTLRLLLSKGEKIEIGGFGTFEVLTDLHGVHIPTFKGGKALKRVLNTPVNEDE